jgi:Putative prokaryotic signal transducing protein
MTFVPLRSFDNYIEANIVMNMLVSFGINAHLKDELTITIDPLLSPALGGMKLMVHHTQIDRAWELLEDAEQQYLKSIPCPVCKAHSLSIVSITKKYKCRLSALINMLVSGKSVELVKMYQCANCGYDFKKLPAE